MPVVNAAAGSYIGKLALVSPTCAGHPQYRVAGIFDTNCPHQHTGRKGLGRGERLLCTVFQDAF